MTDTKNKAELTNALNKMKRLSSSVAREKEPTKQNKLVADMLVEMLEAQIKLIQ